MRLGNMHALAPAVLLLSSRALAVDSIVDLSYSRYRGVALDNGVSQWLGIRYAAPPLGRLRFIHPEDPPQTNGVQPANKHGKPCLATGDDPRSKQTSEDCLFLDVQAPTRATPTAKLPVFVYVQGRGFNVSGNANINASGLIMASGHRMVVISFNYRVCPYGFLADGKDVAPNNGLRDQLKVLRWVQSHIARFGGDPNHVVLGGSSAGSASVLFHMTARNGSSKGLFHAAIAQSPSFATTLDVAQSGYQYRHLATRLGCVGSDSLACLQNKTAEQVQEHNINVPLPKASSAPRYMYVPVIDGDLVPDYTYRLLQQGKLLSLPAILGDDSNGGTKFTPRDTSTLAQSNRFILDQYPFLTLEQLGELNRLYPNRNTTCLSPGCYWRQVSDVYGEARYMCPARAAASALARAGVANTYTYRWNVEDGEQMAQGLGVPHTVELNALWGPEYSTETVSSSYAKGGKNERASPVMQRYWINFIRTFDPNQDGSRTSRNRAAGVPWTPWIPGSEQRLVFKTGGRAEMEPFGRARGQRCDFWANNGAAAGL